MATPPTGKLQHVGVNSEHRVDEKAHRPINSTDLSISTTSLEALRFSQASITPSPRHTSTDPSPRVSPRDDKPRKLHVRQRSRSMSATQTSPRTPASKLLPLQEKAQKEGSQSNPFSNLQQDEQPSSSSAGLDTGYLKAATTDESSVASSSSSSRPKNRTRRMSLADRANSIFFTKLSAEGSSGNKAYATDSFMHKSMASEGSSRVNTSSTKTTVSFLARLLPSFSSKHEAEKIEKPNLSHWLDLEIDLPPGVFAFSYHAIAEIISRLLSSKTNLRRSQERLSLATEIRGSLKESGNFTRLIARKKEIKWLLDIVEKRNLDLLLEIKDKLDALLSCEEPSKLKSLLQKEKSNKFFSLLHSPDDNLDVLKQRLTAGNRLIDDGLLAVASEKIAAERVRRLKLEFGLIKTMVLCDTLSEAMEEIQEIIDAEGKSVTLAKQKCLELQEKIQQAYFKRTGFKSRAIEVLGQSRWKKSVKSTEDFVENQSVAIEMIRLLVHEEQAKENLQEIEGGSGEIYAISCKNSDGARVPIFIFKPLRGAPGMPGNKKDNGPVQLKVCGNRSLKPERIAFPIDEGALREYAVGLLGFEPMRLLTSLKLPEDGFQSSHPGLVMEFVPHLFSITDLQLQVKRMHHQKRIQEIREELETLKGDTAQDSSAKQRELQNKLDYSEKEFNSIEEKSLTSAQQRLAATCLEQLKELGLRSSPIWSTVYPPSLYELVFYSFQVPDMDRNSDNILISQKKRGKKTVYTFSIIDADQTFPDSWMAFKSINPPAWLNSEACNFSLGKLKEDIMRLNAVEMLTKFKENGIYFQESEQTYFTSDGDSEQKYSLGGDLFDILHAFHTVAKVGLISDCTANQIGAILFDNMETGGAFNLLHSLFLQSKRLFKENSSKSHPLLETDDYAELNNHPLYSECLDNVTLPENQKRVQWKLFEALVLQTLKTKLKKTAK